MTNRDPKAGPPPGPAVSAHSRRRQERLQTILSGLSEVQKEACRHVEGPIVVFAGAGSGKTRIITHRIAWLIEKGIPPWEILALTFTNKAAGEMRARVDDLSPFSKRVLIATFHSACARWLREFAPELGFTSDFTIYDDKDSLAAIKTILKDMAVRLDDEVAATDYKAAIGRFKTLAMLPSDDRIAREYQGLLPPAGVQVYQRYQEYLAACNAMDFGDLIMNILLLLRRNETVRNVLRRRYRFIMVDEYQDTNRTQFELISRLAEGHRNLFVVGDDDQSIYSWRGAVPSNIIDFDKTYPEAVRVTMEQNYRCTRHIVDAASAMIAHNKYRVEKHLFTENDEGHQLKFRLETDNEVESWYVVDEITDNLGRYPLVDTAIFYRTNAQSRLLEDALRRENIPYQIYGTVRFYDRMEIKDLLAYLKLCVNDRDDLSLKRIINVPPRGIGAKAVDTIEHEASRRQLSMLATVKEMVEDGYPRIGAKLAGFLQLLEGLQAAVDSCAIEEVMEVLLEKTGYLAYVDKRFADQAVDKTENIHELGAAIADFAQRSREAAKGRTEDDIPVAEPTISDWMQTVTLQSEESESGQGVSLMTLHMAKGLEFRQVFVVGVEEGLLPHRNSLDDPESLEEERRLFYVGMTRAMERLQLTAAYRRRTYNQWAGNRPSRFLSEIPSKHFESVSPEDESSIQVGLAASPSHSSSTLGGGDSDGIAYDFGDPAAPEAEISLQSGSPVRHPTYGKGIVESIENEFGMVKAVVKFGEFGLRKVMARHLELGS